MEITDFFKAARRRLWLIILVPLVGGAAVAGLLLSQPPTYVATAIVDPAALVGSLDSQYTGAQGVNQFVSAFQATASGPIVRRGTMAKAGVTSTELTDNLTVTQRGSSASVAVAFTSEDKAAVVPAVEAVTTLTLDALFSSQVDLAESRVSAANEAVTTADSAIAAFTAKNRMADPQKAYEAQLSRVNSMIQQQASLRASGNPVSAAAMGSSIST